MGRPRLLDLFCGSGGAAMGYHRSGFEVVGVDVNPQPRYPFEFHRADALTFPLQGFDVIHASPPCQLFTSLHRATKATHIDLISPMRTRLAAAQAPYVIENVPGAPLVNTILLCGTMFGLQVRRHRLFEVHPEWHNLVLLPPCSCRGRVANGELIGHRVAGRVAPGRRTPPRHTEVERRDAIGVEWMTARDARQAVPPAYTEWLGKQLANTLLTPG